MPLHSIYHARVRRACARWLTRLLISLTVANAMQDAADVLDAAAPSTLALVDELGKSTSSTDGIAFAWSVAEELLATRTLTMFATHFKELERLPHVYEGAVALHMEAIDDGAQYRQTHCCLPGPCTDTQYGIKLAQKVRLFGCLRREYCMGIALGCFRNSQFADYHMFWMCDLESGTVVNRKSMAASIVC